MTLFKADNSDGRVVPIRRPHPHKMGFALRHESENRRRMICFPPRKSSHW